MPSFFIPPFSSRERASKLQWPLCALPAAAGSGLALQGMLLTILACAVICALLRPYGLLGLVLLIPVTFFVGLCLVLFERVYEGFALIALAGLGFIALSLLTIAIA